MDWWGTGSRRIGIDLEETYYKTWPDVIPDESLILPEQSGCIYHNWYTLHSVRDPVYWIRLQNRFNWLILMDRSLTFPALGLRLVHLQKDARLLRFCHDFKLLLFFCNFCCDKTAILSCIFISTVPWFLASFTATKKCTWFIFKYILVIGYWTILFW